MTERTRVQVDGARRDIGVGDAAAGRELQGWETDGGALSADEGEYGRRPPVDMDQRVATTRSLQK